MTEKAFPLEPIEKASIDELRSLQLKRLQQTLQHAYANSPVYRAKFDAAGVHPDDCKTLADIAKFPFTTKADLRDSYPFGMFAVPRENCARIHASSGTTGKPTVVGYTQGDISRWAELMGRSIRASGGRPGDIIHVVAASVEDQSAWLALLTEEGTLLRNPLARADEIGVLRPWSPPGAFDGVSSSQVNQVLDRIKDGVPDASGGPSGEFYVISERSGRYVGQVVEVVLGVPKQQAKRVIETWRQSGLISEIAFDDTAKKKVVKRVVVNEALRPGRVS